MLFKGLKDHILVQRWIITDEIRELRNEVRQFRLDMEEKWRQLMLTQAQYDQMVADLTAKVSAQTDVDTSAVALIVGLKKQIDDLITRSDGIVDTGQLQKLSDALAAGTKTLADAVAANTTAPTPPVDAPAAQATGGEGQPAAAATDAPTQG